MEGSPRKKLAYCWLLITSLLVSAACLAFPIYVIRPFRHQGARELAAALAVLQVRPIIEAICVLSALAGLPWYWQVQRRRSRRVLAAVGIFFVWGFAVLSRVNVYELMFHPMGHPVFVTSQQVKLDPDDKVIAVKLGGDARAYPIRSIAYHHIVNDVVGQVPIVATYWTLCHTGLVWRRESGGVVLTFHLAGINNQNFLMRDDQTGSYWQQITGAAVSGPLAGRRLTLISSDELSFALWVAEEPSGTVLKDVAKYTSGYAKKDWEVHMKKEPTVLSFADPARGLEPRTLMLGIRAFGASRAFPYDEVVQEKLVLDQVGAEPVLLVVGPDGQSIRAFRDRIPGVEGAPAFYRTLDDKQSHASDVSWLKQAATAPLLMDEATGGEWSFQGCALSGEAKGVCLEQVGAIKDYWFDWRNYNPNTTVYAHKH